MVWTKINPNIRIDCPSCDFSMHESITHRFWLCPMTKKGWKISFSFLYQLIMSLYIINIFKALNLKHVYWTKGFLLNLGDIVHCGHYFVMWHCGPSKLKEMTSIKINGMILSWENWCGKGLWTMVDWNGIIFCNWSRNILRMKQNYLRCFMRFGACILLFVHMMTRG